MPHREQQMQKYMQLVFSLDLVIDKNSAISFFLFKNKLEYLPLKRVNRIGS